MDVLKAFHYEPDEIVYQESVLYKVPMHVFANSDYVEQLVRSHNARILVIEPEYVVIEKTGHEEETEALLHELRAIGIYEFVRSCTVIITQDTGDYYYSSIEVLNAEDFLKKSC